MRVVVTLQDQIEIDEAGWLDYARLCVGDVEPGMWLRSAVGMLEDHYQISLRRKVVEIDCVSAGVFHVPYRHLDKVDWVRSADRDGDLRADTRGRSRLFYNERRHRGYESVCVCGDKITVSNHCPHESISIRYQTSPIEVTDQVVEGVWRVAADKYYGRPITPPDDCFSTYVKSKGQRFYEGLGRVKLA